MTTTTPPRSSRSDLRSVTGLADGLRPAVMRLARRLRQVRADGLDLTPSQLSAMGVLARSDDQPIGALAAAERVAAPSMTRTVNALEEGGYVSRRAHETDGRQVVVVLSERGRTTLLADRARRDAWLARRLRDLTYEERDTLRRAAPILERLANSD